jgi:hypothetical protein
LILDRPIFIAYNIMRGTYRQYSMPWRAFLTAPRLEIADRGARGFD